MRSEDTLEPEIQHADERLRTRWLILLTLTAALGAAGILRLDDYLTELHTVAAGAQPAAMVKARYAARAILALIAVGGVLFSFYLGWISWRVLRHERYPPPGAQVLSDTRIYRGRSARRRGQAGLALAVLTLLLTLGVVARANRVFGRLLEVTLKPTRVEVGARISIPARPSARRTAAPRPLPTAGGTPPTHRARLRQ